MSHVAAFLDRDGTLIRDHNYIASPELVELLPGAALAIRRLNDAGWAVVVATNQSGIARGRLTLDDYESVRRRMQELLEAEGARIDATYMCPHHPDFDMACECRKPGTLMFRWAAADLDLDLSRSWFLGDKLRDVAPAASFGGHGLLIPTAETADADIATATERFAVATSLDEAVGRFLETSK